MHTSVQNPFFSLCRHHSAFVLLPLGAFPIVQIQENSRARFGMEYHSEESASALHRLNICLFVEAFAGSRPGPRAKLMRFKDLLD